LQLLPGPLGISPFRLPDYYIRNVTLSCHAEENARKTERLSSYMERDREIERQRGALSFSSL
jgi:hypothetical protein